MANQIWRIENVIIVAFFIKISILRFLGSLNANLITELKIHNSGSYMTDQKFEKWCIFIKMSILRFLGVLNPNSKPEDNIQNGGSNIANQKFENSLIFLIFDVLYSILKFCYQTWI